jgi:hypothetical protein
LKSALFGRFFWRFEMITIYLENEHVLLEFYSFSNKNKMTFDICFLFGHEYQVNRVIKSSFSTDESSYSIIVMPEFIVNSYSYQKKQEQQKKMLPEESGVPILQT